MDNLNQYQGRSCIIVDSITSIEQKTTEEITVMVKNLFKKLALAREGKQSTIIRFK